MDPKTFAYDVLEMQKAQFFEGNKRSREDTAKDRPKRSSQQCWLRMKCAVPAGYLPHRRPHLMHRLTATIVRIGGVCDVRCGRVPSDQTDTKTRALLGMVVAMIGLAPPIESYGLRVNLSTAHRASRQRVRECATKRCLALDPSHAAR